MFTFYINKVNTEGEIMKFKPILIGLILICSFFGLPVMAADDNGELLKVYDSDGNVVNNAGRASHDSDNEENTNQISNDNNKKSESGSSGDDVWGIKQSDAGFDSLANINTLGGVYMGMTPFRNMSLISISVSAGLALTFVIVGIFILLMLAGFGAGHPNVKKGWELLRGAQGKIAAIGLVFALALFVIIIIFFSLTIFGKIIVMMA
jgi:hypothetical protein